MKKTMRELKTNSDSFIMSHNLSEKPIEQSDSETSNETVSNLEDG